MKSEQLVTLFDKPIKEMSRQELDTEIKLQKYHRSLLRRAMNALKKTDEKARYVHKIRYDKMDFIDNYLKVIDGFIAELERTAETKTDGTEEGRRRALLGQLRRNNDENFAKNSINLDGIQLSWNREKFMLCARDRGYLTEASIIYAVEKELNITRALAKVLLKKGKFTWGQVMCIGAMLQMSPREFCDIFLYGYFVDYHGQFIASYKNVDKTVLLKRATVMNKKELIEADTALAESENAD